MALFRSFGSRHSLREPLAFSTTTRLLTQSVGWSTLLKTPDLTLVSSVCFNCFFKECGTRRAECTAGLQPSLRVMWYFPRFPRPLFVLGLQSLFWQLFYLNGVNPLNQAQLFTIPKTQNRQRVSIHNVKYDITCVFLTCTLWCAGSKGFIMVLP